MTKDNADAVAFFREHAGWSRLKDESDAEGRERSARELADAEEWASNAGYTFGWSTDYDTDPAEVGNSGLYLYLCTMYADDGEILETLGGVDLGEDGTRHPHARVVEAELAVEHAPR